MLISELYIKKQLNPTPKITLDRAMEKAYKEKHHLWLKIKSCAEVFFVSICFNVNFPIG